MALSGLTTNMNTQSVAVVLANLAVIAAVAAAIVAVIRPFLQFPKLSADQQQALPRVAVLVVTGALVALDVLAPTIFQVVAALTLSGVGAMGGKHLLSSSTPTVFPQTSAPLPPAETSGVVVVPPRTT